MQFPGKGRNQGRNRGPVKAARIAVLTGVAGAAVALPLMTANGAQAASVSTWDKVAQCESSGNWQANTGNGHYGGLQFSSSSWAAAGGTQYAPRADQASKGQQIAVAEKLLSQQGPGAWQCAGAGGLTSGGPSADVDTGGGSDSSQQGGGQQTQPQQQAQPDERPQESAPAQPEHSGDGNYTVKSGDTLGSIASAHHTTWKTLFEDNKSVIGGDADLILPGQHLQVG